MNELEELKARAAERRAIRVGPDSDVGVVMSRKVEPAETDLDRAIAIAESRDYFGLVGEAARNGVEAAEWKARAYQAIAAAKALRDVLIMAKLPIGTVHRHTGGDRLSGGEHRVNVTEKFAGPDARDKVLADTAWLEDHEPDREVARRETVGDGQ